MKLTLKICALVVALVAAIHIAHEAMIADESFQLSIVCRHLETNPCTHAGIAKHAK